MNTNISKYKKDFDKLVKLGNDLLNSMQYACYTEEFKKSINKMLKDKSSDFIKSLPDFKQQYQTWYSESKILIKQLLPDRLEDFIRYYRKLKQEKKSLVKIIKLKIIYKDYH